jgi:hypothetical protein
MAKKAKKRRIVVLKNVGLGQRDLLAIVKEFETATREHLDLLEELSDKKVPGVQEKRDDIARSAALLRGFVKRHTFLGADEFLRTLRYEVK